MIQSSIPFPLDVDPYVQAYEAARRETGHARMRDHLPSATDPSHPQALAEMIRVDIEYGWADGRPKRVADYLAEFPELAGHARLIHELAFEEYRQRLECGEQPDPGEYRERYGVDPGKWMLDLGLCRPAKVEIAPVPQCSDLCASRPGVR